MISISGEKSYTKNNNHYSVKPPIFNGEKFNYWKDRIESFFLGYDADLWDLVLDGYTHPIYDNGTKLERSKISDQQRKDHKNHHRSRTIFFNIISYSECERIINRLC